MKEQKALLILSIIVIFLCGFLQNMIIKNHGIDFSAPPAIKVPTSVFRITTVPGSSDPNQDEWPMFHGQLNHTGKAFTTSITSRYPFWNYSTGAALWSSPAVADGRVFVGSLDHKIYCLNASSGKHLWNYSTGLRVFSSPAVADGRVFVGSDDNKIYCLNATTGALHWSYTTGDFVDSSPAVADGRVFVGSWDFKIYCLNATTGIHIWNYTTGDFIYSSPAIASGRVYVGSYDNKVYCINATTGIFLWSYTTGASVYSSPAIASGRVYVGSSDSKIYCLNATTGIHLWHYTTGISIIASPAVAGGRVYVGCDGGKVYCLNATFGNQLWSSTFNIGFSSIAVAGERIYAGSYNNRILCLNATTGTHLWSFQTDDEVASSPAVEAGCVYVSCMDHKVYCLPTNLDNAPPTYKSVTETADPLELGSTETITIAGVEDCTEIQTMLIEFEGTNHSLTNLGGGTWWYNNWTPSSPNTYPYIIYLEDNSSNWNKVIGMIQVVDTIPPTYISVTESADPLGFNRTETITITGVTDFSGIQTMLIEFEGANHTLTNLSAGTWWYNNWTFGSLGNYPYTIYIQDNSGLWNTTTDSIQVIDGPPTFTSVIESADPVVIDRPLTITITGVTDYLGIQTVLIEFQSFSNESMTNLGGGSWRSSVWHLTGIGDHTYTIYLQDYLGNWTVTSGTIHVIDNPPTYETVSELCDPLELGYYETILIQGVYHVIGINTVLIEYEGSNHTMLFIGQSGGCGNWVESGWNPNSTGVYLYTIYIENNNGNWNSTSGSIQVVNPQVPTYAFVTESADPLELGITETITITGVADLSGIFRVLIEFEGSNHTMFLAPGVGTWSYNTWSPSAEGIYSYTIYIQDHMGQSTLVSGSIEVQKSNHAIPTFPFPLVLLGILLAVGFFVLRRRSRW